MIGWAPDGQEAVTITELSAADGLVASPDEKSLADLVEVIEGPVRLAECVTDQGAGDGLHQRQAEDGEGHLPQHAVLRLRSRPVSINGSQSHNSNLNFPTEGENNESKTRNGCCCSGRH